MATAAKPPPHVPARRILGTDAPVIVQMQELLKDAPPDAVSLSQGIVFWPPPKQAMDAVAAAMADPAASGVHGYGADGGDADLVSALVDKCRTENGLVGVDVMVTAGANQAFLNVALALVDPAAGDKAVLLKPYYFNHLMALQISGMADNVVFSATDPTTLLPDVAALTALLHADASIKMVTVVNPGNPTGVVVPKESLDALAAVCHATGAWLVVDNTYELFTFGGTAHYTPCGPAVVNVFSFSKAFGMMGWRVGYIAYPTRSGLGPQLLKVQDTVVICPPRVSQRAALGALDAGSEWVRATLGAVADNLAVLKAAVSCVGADNVFGGDGAFYLMVRLPVADDMAAVVWLAKTHGVVAIPGSACGAPGFIRVACGNVQPGRCRVAAERLKAGLLELCANPGVCETGGLT